MKDGNDNRFVTLFCCFPHEHDDDDDDADNVDDDAVIFLLGEHHLTQ